MARVFISHASDDSAVAQEVRRWLVPHGHQVFLDFHPADGIKVGDEWEMRLHERLRWADAMVCLVTNAFVESVWCSAEVAVARSRGSRLLPVRVERGANHTLLFSVHHADFSADPDLARQMLLSELHRIDVAGGMGWPDGQSPFPGLRPFSSDQHRVFFGRNAEVNQLARLLRSPVERSDPAVLFVVGPSGCGKSSLVRAGLLPVMTQEPGWWALPPMLPGADPVANLAREIASAMRTLDIEESVIDVRRHLEEHGLTSLAGELLHAAPDSHRARLLMVIDQFEELLMHTSVSRRSEFAALILSGMRGPVQVVATLRPEFLDKVLLNAELAELGAHTYAIRPLLRDALPVVIKEPARLAGLKIDDVLVDRLVEDTASGEALPLLAYTLAELADGIGRGDSLQMSRYEQLGGVQGAVTHQADAALEAAKSVRSRTDEQVIRDLLRLVKVDEHSHRTRGRVAYTELPAIVIEELEPFVARRLLTTDADERGTTVEISHDAFLSAWRPMAEAIDANAVAMRAHRRIEHAADEWKQAGSPVDQLWERGQLASALAETGTRIGRVTDKPEIVEPDMRITIKGWRLYVRRKVMSDRIELSSTARHFLLASSHENRRRRARVTTVLAFLLLVSLAAVSVAVWQRQVADQGQRLAMARLLESRAKTMLANDPRTALRLGQTAYYLSPDVESQSNLTQMVNSVSYRGSLVHLTHSLSLAFSPDGRTLAVTTLDGSLVLWDFAHPDQPRPIGSPVTETGPFISVTFSPDGLSLAVSTQDNIVTMWDLTDRRAPRRLGLPLAGHTDAVMSLAFASDGHTLATGSTDGTVILWDVTDRMRPRRIGQPLSGHTGPVTSVVFDAGAHVLAAGSVDGTVILWDTTNVTAPRLSGPPIALPAPVNSVAFAPDGKTIAVGSSDNTGTLWDVTDLSVPRRLGQPLMGQSSAVTSVAFDSSGGRLAVGSYAMTILWDLSNLAEPRTMGQPLGHPASTGRSAFSPDGRTLVADGYEDAIVWSLGDLPEPQIVGQTPAKFNSVKSVAFGPSGRTLAVRDAEATTLWGLADPATPQPIGQPLTDFKPAASSAFGRDGQTLAVAGETTTLWDLADQSRPRLIGQPVSNAKPATSVALASDGKTLAVSGETTTLWDLADESRPRLIGQPISNVKPATSVTFAPNGQVLAVGSATSASAVTLWDLASPAGPSKIDNMYTGRASIVRSVLFSPDGTMLASGSDDGAIVLWNVTDLSDPQPLGQPLTGHSGPVNSIAFAPDGKTLASGGDDGKVILWNLTDLYDPQPLGQPLTGHSGPVRSMAFAPDGKTLASGGDDGVVLMWGLVPINEIRDRPFDFSCTVTHGGLERDEWEKLVAGIEYEDICRICDRAWYEQLALTWNMLFAEEKRPYLYEYKWCGYER